MPLLEIAVFNIESALIAQENGADRVELCTNMKAGGTSPSPEYIAEARSLLRIPFYTMVRPRSGNFVYTFAEFEQMKAEIILGKEKMADGFVFGILTTNEQVDVERNAELIRLASPLPCTFHRAFDEIGNKKAALETIIACGFKRVLTSGGKGNAVDHTQELGNLTTQASGRISVMPGGGIRSGNISGLLKINAGEFHSAAITDDSETANGNEIKKLKQLLSA